MNGILESTALKSGIFLRDRQGLYRLWRVATGDTAPPMIWLLIHTLCGFIFTHSNLLLKINS